MAEKIIKNDTFYFFVPFKKGTDATDDKRVIEGIASTEHFDLQNESVKQDGINIDYFVRHGNLNWDHKDGPENIVGEPLECEKTSKGLFVRGMLYKGHARAEAIWELANAMEKSGSDRRLGFSIQGKVLRKSEVMGGQKRIESCWLQAIAVTANPINTNTYMDVVKALSEESWTEMKKQEISKEEKAEAVAFVEQQEQQSTEKAMSTGHGDPSVTGGESASALRQESLDSDVKVQTHDCKCKKKSCKSHSCKSAHKSLSQEEAVQLIQDEYKVSKAIAEVYAEIVFRKHGLLD